MPVGVTIKTRRGTAAEWSAANPTLAAGEPGYETDTGNLKIGDGVTKYNILSTANKQFNNIITVAKNNKADFVCSKYDSDDKCIQAAIDYCNDNNIFTLYIFSGEYNITESLIATNNLKIECDQNTIFYWNGNGTMLSFSGTLALSTTGIENINAGDVVVYIESVEGIVPGDLVIIQDDTIWNPVDVEYSTCKTSEIHEIKDVNTTLKTINLHEGTLNSYAVINNLKVDIIHPISVELSNFYIIGTGNTGTQTAISTQFCKNTSIHNNKIDKCGYVQIVINNSYNMNIYNNNLSNAEYASEAGSTGYGVSIHNSSAHVNIYNNKISQCRHCIAAANNYMRGQPRDIRIHDNDLYSTIQHAVDAHPCVESIYIYNNSIRSNPSNKKYASVTGSRITYFSGNILNDCYGVSVRGSLQNSIYIIENNISKNGGYIFKDDVNANSTNTESYVKIINNKLFNSKLAMVYTKRANVVDISENYSNGYTTSYGIYLQNVVNSIIAKNYIYDTGRSAISLTDSNDVDVKNNTILNCCTDGLSGSMYEAGIAIRGTSSKINVENNKISDINSKMNYGVGEYNSANNNVIKNNNLSGAMISQILKIGAETKLADNIGYATENTGTATIITGESEVVVTHGLAKAPTIVIISPTAATSGKQYYVSAKGATTFTITIDSVAEGDVTFDWQATL